jgi:hypothetical protein
MKYSMLVCADGNSSLKRFKRAGEDDPRSFDSSYFLSSEFVDGYQNEVRTTSSRGPAKKKQRTNASSFYVQRNLVAYLYGCRMTKTSSKRPHRVPPVGKTLGMTSRNPRLMLWMRLGSLPFFVGTA